MSVEFERQNNLGGKMMKYALKCPYKASEGLFIVWVGTYLKVKWSRKWAGFDEGEI